MPVNINTLLRLPQKERKKIAEALWESLAPVNTLSKEDKEVINLLEKRWENIQSGKSKLYSSRQMKKMINSHRNKK